jgi:hypothetical protein
LLAQALNFKPRGCPMCPADYVRRQARFSSRLVVGGFAAMRLAIGLAFAVAPNRLVGGSDGTRRDTLMTLSFAVREVVLGVGGLLAVKGADSSPAAVRAWAGLGALTDAGDLAASLAAGRRERQSTYVQGLVAAAGLAAELWAFSAPVGA